MIVVATDFSECANDAVAYGAVLAQRLGSEVSLLHVFEPPSFIEPAFSQEVQLRHDLRQWVEDARRHAAERLDRLARETAERGVKAHAVLRDGLPTDEIPLAVAERGAEMLVLGTHGRTGVSRVLLGSVAEAVIRQAPCPVLTVRQGQQPPRPRLMSIAVALDFSPGSAIALDQAKQLATRTTAQLILVHVVEAWPYAVTESLQWIDVQQRLTEVAGALLDGVLGEVRQEAIYATKALSQGTAYQEIVRLATAAEADLIVMGTHGRRGIQRTVVGSVAERVIRLAPCPVLTVRNARGTGRAGNPGERAP